MASIRYILTLLYWSSSLSSPPSSPLSSVYQLVVLVADDSPSPSVCPFSTVVYSYTFSINSVMQKVNRSLSSLPLIFSIHFDNGPSLPLHPLTGPAVCFGCGSGPESGPAGE